MKVTLLISRKVVIPARAFSILHRANVDAMKKIGELSEDEVNRMKGSIMAMRTLVDVLARIDGEQREARQEQAADPVARRAELVAEYADCIQIGARNMQNYSLLKTVGRIKKPVPGDRLAAERLPADVIYFEDYPSNVYPWMALAEKGVQVRGRLESALAVLDGDLISSGL